MSLLRAFVDYLKSLEEFGRAWFGRGRRDAWVEALRHLRRHFGDPSDIEMLYTVFRKLGEILGRGRVGDPASLTLSVSADPRRVKIARILAKALELYRLMGRPAELGPVAPAFRGVERQRVYGSLSRLTKLSASAWSLLVGAFEKLNMEVIKRALRRFIKMSKCRGVSGLVFGGLSPLATSLWCVRVLCSA